MAANSNQPDLGPNVLIFSPSMPSSTMQRQIDQIYATQQHNEFGSQRNALLFLPGDYKLDIPVGFYTEVMGLGASPDGVRITGNVHADASEPNNNATTTFWRAARGLLHISRWRQRCNGPYPRPHPFGACTSAAILCSISTPAGRAADGCPTP